MTIAQTAPPLPTTLYDQLEPLAARIKAGQVLVADICRYCDALFELGLPAAVEDFFRSVQVSHPQWANYQEVMRAKIAPLPQGMVSWASRKRRFQANLAAVLKRWPAYAPFFTDCEAGAVRYQLHLANDGNYQLRDTANPHPIEGWSGGLKDQKSLASLWKYKRTGPDLASPVAFDGAGFGWLLLHVLETTRNTYLNYSPAVYLIEPDPLAAWMLLHLHDLREWLEHPRLQVFLGPDAAAQYRDFLQAGTHSLADYCFTNPLTQRPACKLVEIAGAECTRRREQTGELRQRIEALYAGRTPATWHNRFAEALAGGRPLKILGLTSRFTTVLRYSMEELACAVRAAGHEFRLSIEADDSTLERTDLAAMCEFQPDLLVQISRMRWENSSLPTCIPFLCWDQDYLSGMRAPEARTSLDDLTYVAGHAATHGYHAASQAERWPARNCIFCHPAAAAHRYPTDPAPLELHRALACDFSYVSNASDPPEVYARELARTRQAHVPAEIWNELIDQVLCSQDVCGDAGHWAGVIRQTAERLGRRAPENLTDLALDLVKIVDRRFRHEALAWAADYCQQTGRTLKLFGAGWENHPRFRPFASGFMEPGLPMRALYQATKINLQLILSGFLHSRALDGLAAGGFFLTRFSPADHDPDPRAPDFYIMARRALDLGIWNFEQLVAAADPEIAERRERYYVDQVRALQLSDYVCFHIAGELPAAATVFPQISRISFRSAAEFAALCNHLLHEDGQRRALAESMQEIVRKRFSYDARLSTFLQRMTRGFAQQS